jgi:hypothetical protein
MASGDAPVLAARWDVRRLSRYGFCVAPEYSNPFVFI